MMGIGDYNHTDPIWKCRPCVSATLFYFGALIAIAGVLTVILALVT